MMTEKNQSEETRQNMEPGELSERLVPDPANPNVKRLEGFVMGKSNIEENWRLYLSPDMNHYLEFRKEDTLHAQQVSSTKAFVWVTPRAEVKEVMFRSGPINFLRGTLVHEHLRRKPRLLGPSMPLFAMAADGSGCAHTGCSAGCTEGYGCGAEGTSAGFTCGC